MLERAKLSLDEKADICMLCGVTNEQGNPGCLVCREGHLVEWGHIPGDYSVNWLLYREITERLREGRHDGEVLMTIADNLAKCGVLDYVSKPVQHATTCITRAESYLVMRGVERLNPLGSVGLYYFNRHIDAVTYADIQRRMPGIPVVVFALVDVVK